MTSLDNIFPKLRNARTYTQQKVDEKSRITKAVIEKITFINLLKLKNIKVNQGMNFETKKLFFKSLHRCSNSYWYI